MVVVEGDGSATLIRSPSLIATGNGGSENDDCNADGYANSIYTIAVGAITEAGTKPWSVIFGFI